MCLRQLLQCKSNCNPAKGSDAMVEQWICGGILCPSAPRTETNSENAYMSHTVDGQKDQTHPKQLHNAVSPRTNISMLGCTLLSDMFWFVLYAAASTYTTPTLKFGVRGDGERLVKTVWSFYPSTVPAPKPRWRGLQDDGDLGFSLKNTYFVT